MKVDLVQVPWDSGHRGARMGAGPLRLVEAGLPDVLAEAGHDVRLEAVELEGGFSAEIASAFELARGVAERVREAERQARLPLVLAGNCISAVGTVAGLGRPALYWFDAHADLHTPESTASGFLDGMALSILLGRCWRGLAGRAGLEPVTEDAVCIIGARDVDAAEEEFLAASEVRRLDAAALPGALPAVRGARAYVHIDLDCLDPGVGRANDYAADGGLTLERLLDMIDAIAARAPIAAAALTAYDPAVDSDGAVAEAALRIAERLASG